MSDQFPGFVTPDAAGPNGETLELCSPIPWPGDAGVTKSFVESIIVRLVAASYRPPELLNLFALKKAELNKLLLSAKCVFSRESNIVDIVAPPKGRVHVFGDTHGDLHSLVRGLSIAGWPSEENIICFAGDCVDRGSWGIEVLVVILALKMWKKECVYLLRGNHETTGCISRYGFENEVLRKYDTRVLTIFIHVFQELPCAAIIINVPLRAVGTVPLASAAAEKRARKGGRRTRKNASLRLEEGHDAEREGWRKAPVPGETRTMVVHGGLFRSWSSLKKGSMMLGDLKDLAEWRRQSPDPANGIIEDVLWSDPQVAANDVSPNILRGAGILFGRGAVEAFFKRNNLHGLIRAHEGPDMREKRPEMNDMLDGYSVDIELINGYVATVFSSAMYPPDKPRGNKGAFATLHGKESKRIQVLPEFTQFERPESPSDFVLFYEPEDGGQSATPRTSFS